MTKPPLRVAVTMADPAGVGPEICSRLLPLAFACLAAVSTSAADFARDIQPRLRLFCTDCHDADAKKGGLDLARFTSDAATLADRATWKRVFD